jgi:hypothetical protein
MSRYLETAQQLGNDVEKFVECYISLKDRPVAVRALGHLLHLAVRCNPRQIQGTVRKNIITEAIGKYCSVRMTKEHDEQTGRKYNKIHIEPHKQGAMP